MSNEAPLPALSEKIAVAVERPDVQSVISEVFGRSDYFLLFDTVNNTEEIILNPFAKTFGGAGIQSAQLLVENNVDVLITNKIGANALRVLNSAGIKVYMCMRENAKTAVQLFNEGKLKTIETKDVNILGNKHRRRYGHRN